MTGADLDEIERLVAASDRWSPLPWYDDGEDLRSSDDGWVCARPESRADADAIIALRNAAPELLALAREAIEARKRRPALISIAAGLVRLSHPDDWPDDSVPREPVVELAMRIKAIADAMVPPGGER
jgi:hypothetical protein